jgi:hypothetical protein
MHELQRLLHLLNLAGALRQEPFPLAHRAAQPTKIGRRAERSRSQASGVPLLERLAVEQVALAA